MKTPLEFPPYSYVPGGPWPHPIRDPGGHMHGSRREMPPPIRDERTGEDSDELRLGLELFDAGYYWEAHEVWEGLWAAHGRRGATADLLKGLIKLAAAGVKIREGLPDGARTHAERASRLIASVRESCAIRLGLKLDRVGSFAAEIAQKGTTAAHPLDAAAVVVFDRRLSDCLEITR